MTSNNDWLDELFNEVPVKSDAMQLEHIEQLLGTSCIEEERKAWIYKSMSCLTYPEANELINELQNKQIDRISGGLNYNQAEIIKHQRGLK